MEVQRRIGKVNSVIKPLIHIWREEVSTENIATISQSKSSQIFGLCCKNEGWQTSTESF